MTQDMMDVEDDTPISATEVDDVLRGMQQMEAPMQRRQTMLGQLGRVPARRRAWAKGLQAVILDLDLEVFDRFIDCIGFCISLLCDDEIERSEIRDEIVELLWALGDRHAHATVRGWTN